MVIERNIPPYEPRKYWTPEQTIQFFQKHDTPLNRDVFRYHLLNLAGTSFVKPAVEGMLRQFRLGYGHPELNFMRDLTHAGNLYTSLSGMNKIDYFTGRIEDQQLREKAIAAMQTAILPPFTPRNVYGYETIRPDELMVQLWRTDDVFTDTEDGYAYTYLTRQTLFFKRGVLVDGIGIATLSYKLFSGEGRMHSILLEGLHEVDYFTDPERKVLSFVHPDVQRFNDHAQRSHTSLFIGPSFHQRQASYRQT